MIQHKKELGKSIEPDLSVIDLQKDSTCKASLNPSTVAVSIYRYPSTNTEGLKK